MAASWVDEMWGNYLAQSRMGGISLPTTGSSSPSTPDLASLLIANAKVKWNPSKPVKPPKGKGKEKPSVWGRIIDVLSRPLYATAETMEEHVADLKSGKGIVETGLKSIRNLPENWAEGWSGKEKTTGREVYKALHGRDPKGLGEGVGTFGMDVLMDPLTYVPGGALLTIGKAATRGSKVAAAGSEFSGK